MVKMGSANTQLYFTAEVPHANLSYLRMPAHIADAYYLRWDTGAVYFGRRRVERHGKCFTPVQDLDYPAVEGPDLESDGIGSVTWEIKQTPPERSGRHARVFFRQRIRSRCTVLPLSQQD
jgi:hypothetical protein